MSWAAIIAIVIEILKQRAAAGWPLLKLLLDYFSRDVQKAADADVSAFTVGAAPDELKKFLTDWLEKQKASAGVGLRFAYTLMIRFLPLVADEIWDKLFSLGMVGKSASEFTQAVGSGPTDEMAIIESI